MVKLYHVEFYVWFDGKLCLDHNDICTLEEAAAMAQGRYMLLKENTNG